MTIAASRSAAASTKRRPALRKAWLQIHLWLGLSLGVFFSIVGVTGSALVFYQEIDEWLNPALMTVRAPAGSAGWRPLEEIANAARAAMPADSHPGWVHYPQDDTKAFNFSHQVKNPASENLDVRNVFVDPYTAKVTGTRLFYSGSNPLSHSFTGFLFKLHYSLLAWDVGTTTVGVIAVFAFFSSVSGVVLWWPKNGKWCGALTPKWPARAERLNFDLHRLFGFYFLPVALASLLSGVHFNLPNQFRGAVEVFSPITKGDRLRSNPRNIGHVTLDEALATAARLFPNASVYAMTMPKPPKDGPYIVTQLFDIGWGMRGRRAIFVDQFSGDVLHVNDPLAGDGDAFLQWQWSLHSGYVFGWAGRIVIFLFGLSWPLIFVTGVVRWLQKRRAQRIHDERALARSAGR